MSYRIAIIDDLQDIPYRQDTHMRPVRHHLGISAFGTNAWTAANQGDRLLPEHREDEGKEELYVVLRGRARFEIDGDSADAPLGTLVFVGPESNRTAFAEEAGTTVLAIGGVPGTHEPSPWEYFFPALPAHRRGDWDTARRILEEALEEKDHSAIRYALACVEARAGNGERSLDLLAQCDDDHKRHARGDEDFDSLRDDPRFLTLTGQA